MKGHLLSDLTDRFVKVSLAISGLALSSILLLTLPTMSVAQSFSYAAINVPGAVATEARGINNNGEIVGSYKTTVCQDYDITVPSCPVSGFKYVNGSYIKLMVPNSTSTAIMGVNDFGDLVGFYKKGDGTYHGFIWFHQNIVRTIDFPGTKTGTVPFGINRAGIVVGGLWGISSQGTFPSSGWVWVNGTFSNMNPTPQNPAGPCCWSVNGIADSGVIAGQIFNADFNQAWFKASTDEDFFLSTNGTDTFATGVNSNNDVIGFSPGTGGAGWFVPDLESNEGTAEATEVKPTFIKVAFPNAANGSTTPLGVNDLKAVVGTYTDSSGHQHGFFAKANF